MQHHVALHCRKCPWTELHDEVRGYACYLLCLLELPMYYRKLVGPAVGLEWFAEDKVMIISGLAPRLTQ